MLNSSRLLCKLTLFCKSLLVFLFLSCGLDYIVYLAPPKFERRQESDDDSQQYLLFRTSDTDNTIGYCRGFDVLYRIYSNRADLDGDVNDILSYNKSNPQAVARYAMETKKYQRLTAKDFPPIKFTGTDRLIRIRLCDYGDEKAGLSVDGNPNPPLSIKRFNSSEFKNISTDETADDISSKNPGPYTKVAFFAVASGSDELFVPIYSELLYLGYLTLK